MPGLHVVAGPNCARQTVPLFNGPVRTGRHSGRKQGFCSLLPSHNEVPCEQEDVKVVFLHAAQVDLPAMALSHYSRLLAWKSTICAAICELGQWRAAPMGRALAARQVHGVRSSPSTHLEPPLHVLGTPAHVVHTI